MRQGRRSSVTEAVGSSIRREYLAQEFQIGDVALDEFAAGRNGTFDLHRATIADVVDGGADFFEVDARHITFATLSALARDYGLPHEVVQQAMRDLEIRPDKVNPMRA